VTFWINISTNPITGVEKNKLGVWTKVAFVFNKHAPDGVAKKTSKVGNARQNHVTPLVSQWCAFVVETYQ